MKLTARERFPYPVRKAWRVMRITTLLILVFCLHLSAKTTAQKITLTSNNISIEQFFNQLEKQTGYSFLLENGVVSKDQKVSVKVKDAPLEAVLDQILKPINLSFKIENKTVYILKSQPVSSSDSSSPVTDTPPLIDIHGHVTDSLGNPLARASVTIKGNRRGTSTDANGDFILKGISENSTLNISFTGYDTKSIRLNGNNSYTVSLVHSTSLLDQVQIIAYGTTTQRFSTGDVTTVTAKEIEKQPVSNALLALEGNAPGLSVIQNTGVAGGGVTVRIQGQNSLVMGNDPLFVIDGVPFTSQLLPNISGPLGILGSNGSSNLNTQTGGGSPFNFINPADIESISILKDADATAIYGSRAANGAILITTKKGKAGKTNVDFNIQQGIGEVTRMLPVLNTPEYLDMRHEALNNDGLTPDPNYDYDLTFWDTTRYTNWQKALIGGTAQYTDAQGSVSGGTTNTTFLVSGGYHRETSVFPGNLADQKGSMHFNINNTSSDQRFSMNFTGLYTLDENHLISTDLTNMATWLSPDAPPLYNPDGTLNWATLPNGNSSWFNPLAYLKQTYDVRTSALNGNLLLSYKLLSELTAKVSLGYNDIHTNEVSANPLTFNAPETQIDNTRLAQFQNGDLYTWNVEPQITYVHSFGDNHISALLGTTFLETNSNYQRFIATGFNSDLSLTNINSAANIFTFAPNPIAVYNYTAGFGRISYNWKEKYIINLNARRDGSSRFGSNNMFHNFGSIAGAWLFSQESFIKDNLPVLSFGKLRLSYGTTGNDQVGDYQYLGLFNPTYAPTPYQGIVGYQPSGLANPNLQWELTKKLDAGLDIGLFNEDILLNANYFYNQSSNQLLGYNLPITTGFTSIERNFPAVVQNTGIELMVTTKNIRGKNFSWTTSFNVTIPRNKLVSFPDLATSSYASAFTVGKPVTSRRVFHSLGVNDSTGLYQFSGNQGPTYSPTLGVDNTAIVNPAPQFYGGLQNEVRYKGLNLSFLFSFTKQIASNDYFGQQPGWFNTGDEPYSLGPNNQPIWTTNRWQKPGQNVPIQKYSSIYNPNFYNIYSSDAGFSDGSFIRLKNVALSYDFPASWKTKAKIQALTIFIHAQNLLTITKYKGMDPENLSTASLPPLKVITVGLHVGF